MKNRPQYAVESVDNALRVALLLQHEGPMGVSEVADRVGVARSTAHRLLATLVYRDFAEQTESKRYSAGPALRGAPAPSSAAALQAVARAHLEALRDHTGETANLQTLVGDQVRFVVSVESRAALRVGDREGRLLPARLVSGGQLLLAALPESALTQLFADDDPASYALLRRQLRAVRRRGFAINDQQTETGVTALAALIHAPDGSGVAAVSVAMPSARFARSRVAGLVDALHTSAQRIEAGLAALAPSESPG